MPKTETLQGGGGKVKRKTHTPKGELLKTYFLCDTSGNEIKRYKGHEARNAPPSAAARKLAKHVVGKKSGSHTLHVRARGPHGKFKDGKPKVFSYSVSRVLVDVPPWMIQQSQEHNYRTQYEAGDKMHAYKVVSKRKPKSRRKSAKSGRRKSKAKSRSRSPRRKSRSKSKSKSKRKRSPSRSSRGKKRKLAGGGRKRAVRGGGGAEVVFKDFSELDDSRVHEVLDKTLYAKDASAKQACNACKQSVKADKEQQKYVVVLDAAMTFASNNAEGDNDLKRLKNHLNTKFGSDKFDVDKGSIKLTGKEDISTPLGPQGAENLMTEEGRFNFVEKFFKIGDDDEDITVVGIEDPLDKGKLENHLKEKVGDE